MTNEIASILERLRLFVEQHAPAELLQQAVPFAIVCLVAGVGLSVLGAKVARFGATGAFVLLGAYAGVLLGRETGYPLPVCGAVGALMIGVIGHQTFRLWVGLVTASVLSLATLGVFSYQRVIPHIAEFEGLPPVVTTEEASSFELPSPEEQQAYRDRSIGRWAKDLWGYVVQQDVQVERNGKALAALAMLSGLCLGVVAVRWALILSTSVIGTALVTTAIGMLLARSAPDSYQAFQAQPGLVGAVVGAFLVSSLVVQVLLTRKAPSGKQDSSAKS
jgi:hypothetical protein